MLVCRQLKSELLKCIPISTYRLKDYSSDKYFTSCLRDSAPKRKYMGAYVTFKLNLASSKNKTNISEPVLQVNPVSGTLQERVHKMYSLQQRMLRQIKNISSGTDTSVRFCISSRPMRTFT